MMRCWPSSLFGRNLALLIALVLVSQLCAVGIWNQFVRQPRIDNAAAFVASQLTRTQQLMAALPPATRQEQIAALHGIRNNDWPPAANPPGAPYLLRGFLSQLRARLPADVQLYWHEGAEPHLWVQMKEADGFWIPLPIENAANESGGWSLLLILLSLTTFPTLAAYLIYRRIEPPLRRLSLAANQIEQGQWPPAVPVTGPLEIATVIDAFNRMSATLASDEATRAEMLAGISHDIRTPLTKLRMVTAAPQLFESPTAMAERFAEEIDAVLGQFIDFARSDEEALTPGDLNALLEQLAGGYAGLGHPFTLDLQALPLFHYRPAAIQRLLMNLMQNAVTYGRTGLALHSSVAGKFIVLRIADRGPGAPPHSLERLKQAFQRGPGNNAKGSGLGLAIAERVAREHGGSLVLQPGDGAGLVAIVSLPLTR